MIASLVAELQLIDPEITDKDIADALWLALQIRKAMGVPETEDGIRSEAPRSNTLPKHETNPLPVSPTSQLPASAPKSQSNKSGLYPSSSQSRSGGQPLSALPFRSPAAAALPASLEIARVLRPFGKRVPQRGTFVLNEETTAKRIAEEDIWVPVLDYALTRWLEVAFVIDTGKSMTLWRQTITELYRLLTHHGAFRNIRLWELDTNNAQEVHLFSGTGEGVQDRQPRNALELIDTSCRRLVLVVTDCVSPAWHSGRVTTDMLAKWSHYNSVTLLQVLPQRLWSRTALGTATPVHLRAITSGPANTQLQVQSAQYWVKKKSLPTVPIPIVTLEPGSLALWAKAIARAEDVWIPGFKLVIHPEPTEKQKQYEEVLSVKHSASELAQRFHANASTSAWRLAGLLAMLPVTLPIVRLVQQAMFDEPQQVHIAEVFLSGLLKITSANSSALDSDDVQYDFVDGVRETLLNSVSPNDSSRLLTEISTLITSKFAHPLDFDALLTHPLGREKIVIDKENRPFALLGAMALRRFGGEYVALADWLEEESIKGEVQENKTPMVTGAYASQGGDEQNDTKDDFQDLATKPSTSVSAAGDIGKRDLTQDNIHKNATGTESSDLKGVDGQAQVQGEATLSSEQMYVGNTAPVSIYCSYAHEDENLLIQLEQYLIPLQTQGLITYWHSGMVSHVDAEDQKRAIDKHLNTAQIILLLTSADFMDSDYCDDQTQRALQRHRDNKARVIPILVRPYQWDDAPFIHLQPLPFNGKPITQWKDQGAAFDDVSAGIQRVVEDLQALPETIRPKEIQTQPIEIFLAYAHRDESLLIELERYLSPLVQQGLITTWSDRQILPGADRDQTLNMHLTRASLILLLISADFLASDSYGDVMQRALQPQHANETRVIPIIARPCMWESSPFAYLPVLPKNANPITMWTDSNIAFADVIDGIRRAIEDPPTSQALPETPKTKKIQADIEPIEIFFVYAREDELLLIELEKHLSPLVQQGLIRTWSERLIPLGTDYWDQLNRHLERASLILLLISADFLASDSCSEAMQRALQRQQANEARVISILIRPCIWESAPFAYLPVLPTNVNPITNWNNLDAAFVDVVGGIRRVIEDPPTSQALPETPKPKKIQANAEPIEIFFAYAREDESLLVKLEKHLSPLVQQGLIKTWSERLIPDSHDWEERDTHLEHASLFLLLISADFLASDSCSEAMQRALQRQQANEARVIPILIRPCVWANAPFAYLPVLPTNFNPITNWNNLDAAFVDVVGDIRRVIEDLPNSQTLLETPKPKKIQANAEPIEIFFAYAHEDESLLTKLEKHLSPLVQQGLIRTWSDRQIRAGTHTIETLETHLESASLFLLFVSPNFLTSHSRGYYVMQRALQRQQANTARVIPILIRPCVWANAPFAYLPVLPTNFNPITNWSNPDAAFVDVVNGIRRVIEDLPSLKAAPPPPSSEKPHTMVDFAIITVLDEEYYALYRRFEPRPQRYASGHTYGISQIQSEDGKHYTIAIGRHSGVVQQLTRDMIKDLSPTLLLVVGTADAVPDTDFTLGDVIVSSRIHIFNSNASKPDEIQWDVRGDIHPYISEITATLPLYHSRLQDWNNPASISVPRPNVDPKKFKDFDFDQLTDEDERNIFGGTLPLSWQKKILSSLKWNFGSDILENSDTSKEKDDTDAEALQLSGQRSANEHDHSQESHYQNTDIPPRQTPDPIFRIGSVASSNRLIRNSSVLIKWLETTHSILALETKTAGVSQVAEQIPVMAILGISDIVGLRYEDGWTRYACHTAAAFTDAFIKAGIVEPKVSAKEEQLITSSRTIPADASISYAHPLTSEQENKSKQTIKNPSLLTSQQKSELVEKLLACQSMKERSSRDRVIKELPFAASIARSSSADKVDIMNIVSRCLDFEDGLQQLIKIIILYESNATALHELLTFVQSLL
jgi:nucleoside phosphorylase